MTDSRGILDDPGLAARWVAFIAALLYLPSMANGFAYDDIHILVDNDAIHTLGSTLGSLLSPWWPGEEGNTLGLWRPFTTLAFGLQWALGGGAAWPYHLVNIGLHAAVSVLVVRVGAVLFAPRSGVLAGLVFAIHPLHVEAVANGVGQAELWAALWMLGAVAVLTAAPREEGERVPVLGIGRTAALVGLYIAACLTKENAIVLPALLLVVEAARYRWTPADLPGLLRGRVVLVGAFAIVAAGILLARIQILGQVADPTPPLGATLLAEVPRIHTLGEIWFQYLRLLAIPLTLSPDYAPGVVPVTTIWTGRGVLAVAVVLLLACAAWLAGRIRDERSVGAVGLLWFVIAVLPVSNVLFVAGILVAERTLYLPSVGAAWVLGSWIALAIGEGRRWGRVAVALVVALWIGRTVTYQPIWKDAQSVFDTMVAIAPESARSQWILGDMLLDAGRLDEGTRAYARALNDLGEEIPFLTQSARRLHQAGAVGSARALALRAWEASAPVSAAQLLTVMAAGEGEWTETVRWARATRDGDPLDPVAGHLLSVAHAELGQWEDARAVREELLARDPGDAWQPWFWLMELRGRTGDTVGVRSAADSARSRTSDPGVRTVIDSVLIDLTGGQEPL